MSKLVLMTLLVIKIKSEIIDEKKKFINIFIKL